MTLIEQERRASSVRADGPGGRDVRRLLRQHHGRRWPRSAAARPTSARCRDDQLGEVFGHDIRAAGVSSETPPLAAGPPTARCLMLVTPDAQRTMAPISAPASSSGRTTSTRRASPAPRSPISRAISGIAPDAKAACPQGGDDRPSARPAGGADACRTRSASTAGGRVPDLIAQHVDILFANEVEICSLYGADELEQAVELVRGQTRLAALTRSAEGSVLVAGARTERVPAAPVARVIDSTGAGDLYAAGLLYGLTHGLSLAACGRLGSLAAAAVLGQLGARPEQPLAPLVEKASAAAADPTGA